MQPRHIFTRRYWQDFWIDIQRSGKDPRARNRMWLRCAFLIYLMAVVTYYSIYFSSFHDLPTALGIGAVTVAIFAAMRAVAWSEDRAARRQTLADIASAPAETTARLQRLAHAMAAITERALSEAWLRHNTVPEGHSPVMRRITLEALRKHGAWDDMPLQARDWMIRPDGAWPQDRTVAVLLRAETLNTILWALALIDTLRPAEDFLKTLSLKQLAVAMQKPAPGIRPPWDMRLERDRAESYFNRCYAEAIHRGMMQSQSEEQRVLVERWLQEIAESQGSDYLAGAATIAELEDAKLQQVVMSANSRAAVLRLLMNAVDGQDAWEGLYEHVYGPLLQPAQAEVPAT